MAVRTVPAYRQAGSTSSPPPTSPLPPPAFMAHMDPPTPSVAWTTALWQAALNQNLLHPDVAPKARLLSERVVTWIAPFFGMGGGHFVPGSSISNLTALWAARELKGVTKVASSKMAHLSVSTEGSRGAGAARAPPHRSHGEPRRSRRSRPA